MACTGKVTLDAPAGMVARPGNLKKSRPVTAEPVIAYSTVKGAAVLPVREIVTIPFEEPDSVVTEFVELIWTVGRSARAKAPESRKTRLPVKKTDTRQQLRIRSTATGMRPEKHNSGLESSRF
jgi:hypothetical protein